MITAEENESYSDETSFSTSDSDSLIDSRSEDRDDKVIVQDLAETTELNLNSYLKVVSIRPNQSRSHILNKYFTYNRSIAQSKQPILITEAKLILECITLLSGIKSSVVFVFANGTFRFNKKFTLKHLKNELDQCLEPICEYAQKILRIRKFIEQSRNQSIRNYKDNCITKVFEIFSQCLNEYIKYFHAHLQTISLIVKRKEVAFTLVDFIEKLRHPYFNHLDTLDCILKSLNEESNNDKSISLICKIHTLLVDSYSTQTIHTPNSKLLVWLFVRCLSAFLQLIDKLLNEPSKSDDLTDLGFKQNEEITIKHSNYWQNGLIFTFRSEFITKLPQFMRDLLLNSFKISKNIQIIKILNDYKCDSNFNGEFFKILNELCPFLKPKHFHIDSTQVKQKSHQSYANLLELNFTQLKPKIDEQVDLKCMNAPLIKLFENHSTTQINDFNIEYDIEQAIKKCLYPYVNLFSSMLVDNLSQKHNLFTVFAQIHAYFFFKSNETMFVFSKNLFELVKSYETYQQDIILNNLYLKALTQLNIVDNEIRQLFSFTYAAQGPLVNTSPTKRRPTLSSRLISGIKIKFTLDWPFSLVLNEKHFEIYNEFYLMFLQLKQVKYDLESCDFREMSIRKKFGTSSTYSDDDSERTLNDDPPLDPQLIHQMYLIRYRLMNFINNVHDLICNQVYELSDSFIQALMDSRDLDTIIRAHEAFLLKLSKQSLKGISKVFMPLLMQFFDIILRFGDRWRRGPYALNKKVIDDFDGELNDSLRFLSNTLNTILAANSQASPLITILLYSTENNRS